MLKYLARYGTASLLIFAMNTLCLAQSTGADTYKAKCQMCHAADGGGDTPAGKAMKALPFNSPDVLKASDSDLIAIVKNGKGKMPAFDGKITDAQIKDVVAYIRTLQKK
jgi:cytochrome c6